MGEKIAREWAASLEKSTPVLAECTFFDVDAIKIGLDARLTNSAFSDKRPAVISRRRKVRG